MSYEGPAANLLEEAGVDVGDRVKVSKGSREYVGILMPRSGSDKRALVIKLDGGYNVGIDLDDDCSIEKLSDLPEGEDSGFSETGGLDREKGDGPKVAVLLAGGTIASRVDYRTGAVKASIDEDELVSFVPEIAKIADIEGREVLRTLSEKIVPEDWQKIAVEVEKEIENGKDGIVIAHGTDTMGYTAAALSFMLEDLPVPVVLVGSQRSSDRGSSDARQNLVCAVRAATSDIAEVVVCMHGESSDTFCYLHPGTRARKMHTSRRDAFRTVNERPFAKVDWENLEIQRIREDYRKKDRDRKIELKNGFEEDVELVKVYPGIDADVFSEHLERSEGVVIEGTGLGHMPLEEDIKTALEEYTDGGNIAFMASQCIHGRVNMNVYETGVDLQDVGVIGNYSDMLPETAYVKLGWILGNYDKDEARELMLEDMRGEISRRTEHEDLKSEISNLKTSSFQEFEGEKEWSRRK